MIKTYSTPLITFGPSRTQFLEHRPDLAEQIRTGSNSPADAFDEAHRHKNDVRKDWNSVNITMVRPILPLCSPATCLNKVGCMHRWRPSCGRSSNSTQPSTRNSSPLDALPSITYVSMDPQHCDFVLTTSTPSLFYRRTRITHSGERGPMGKGETSLGAR